jgi:hypothetical protein
MPISFKLELRARSIEFFLYLELHALLSGTMNLNTDKRESIFL